VSEQREKPATRWHAQPNLVLQREHTLFGTNLLLLDLQLYKTRVCSKATGKGIPNMTPVAVTTHALRAARKTRWSSMQLRHTIFARSSLPSCRHARRTRSSSSVSLPMAPLVGDRIRDGVNVDASAAPLNNRLGELYSFTVDVACVWCV
jgi:hypothetical protein